jgi:NADH-quinone oxidoreductase subunit J
MSAVLFFVAAIGALAGAIGVVALRNPFYNVLALVCHLLSLAALFLLLRAEFVAAAQVVVYAGAVMVLYVFVVAYVGSQDEPVEIGGTGLRAVALLFCGALLVELCIAVLGSGLKAIDTRGAAAPAAGGFGTPGRIGDALLTKFLFAFEAASILLLVAAVGAIILARRRRGLGEDGEEAPLSGIAVRRPAYSGTMLEGVGYDYERALPAAGATSREPEPAGGRAERGGW